MLSRRMYALLFVFLLLLIVIAIIPMFVRTGHIKPFTSLTRCRYNMRTLWVALELYSSDFDDHFPPGSYSAGRHTKGAKSFNEWHVLDKYADMNECLKCPKDTTHSASSYIMNPLLVGCYKRSVTNDVKSQTPLLSERSFTDSHRFVCYLNGHVGTSGEPNH